MSFKMFRAADPTRRIPTYLQAHTKENVIWQLKLAGVVCLGMYFWTMYEDHQLAKARDNAKKTTVNFSEETD